MRRTLVLQTNNQHVCDALLNIELAVNINMLHDAA
ncbi:hypothetical protein BH10BAC2_BH10BAC2_23980 [soil metagenome]